MKYLYSILVLTVLAVSFAFAQKDLPDPMSPPRMVNDFADVFTAGQRQDLENILRAYHDSTTTQIYVVTVNSLGGDAPYNYAARLGNKWGIGQKGKDNGVLILIKPKTADERGEVFISTGYGTEARLNDAAAGRIIDEYMIPYLQKNNDYYSAVKNAVYAIIARLSGEFSGGDVPKNPVQKGVDWLSDTFFLCCILPLFIVLFIVSRKFRMLVLFLFSLGGGGRRGGGGGGFGGGGGGRFGGGGAGRSW